MKGIVAHYGKSMIDLDETRRWAKHVLPLASYTPWQVVSAAADMPSLREDSAGVYFLLRKGKICYVGKSVNLLLRLHQHSGRPFDQVAVISGVPQECCSSLEAAYVNAWNPPWNVGPCYEAWEGAKALQKKLARMDLSLICDQPEHPPLTEAEMERIVKALDGLAA